MRKAYRSLTGLMAMGPVLPLFCLLVWAGCDFKDTPPSGWVVYEVRVSSGETFRIALEDPALIEQADSVLAADRVGVVHGHLAYGDGGFNAPYGWHLLPESVSFPDIAFEVCSGRPLSDVEADLPYWIESIGVYCPWGARLVRRADDAVLVR